MARFAFTPLQWWFKYQLWDSEQPVFLDIRRTGDQSWKRFLIIMIWIVLFTTSKSTGHANCHKNDSKTWKLSMIYFDSFTQPTPFKSDVMQVCETMQIRWQLWDKILKSVFKGRDLLSNLPRKDKLQSTRSVTWSEAVTSQLILIWRKGCLFRACNAIPKPWTFRLGV